MTVLPGTGAQQYACTGCGAALEFAPGTTGLVCPYCQAQQALSPEQASPAGSTVALGKHDYFAYRALPHTAVAELPAFQLACRGCGSTNSTTAVSARCPHCTAPLVSVDTLDGRLLAADAVVPFAVDKAAANAAFKEWTGSRWFAPNALKKVGTTEKLHGAFAPHWGFDDDTISDYTGERGEHYYVTETYTEMENGKSVTKTRQVQHTRWYPAGGQVRRAFQDVLATAASSPDQKVLGKLGPWPVLDAGPFRPELLAGLDVPRYDRDPADGWVDAQQQMASVIEQDCRQDIGGDEQRVHQVSTRDADVLFRLLLMPLWLATYLAAGVTYTVYINANTGKVIGDRPYSKAKIAAAVALALVVALVAYLVYVGTR